MTAKEIFRMVLVLAIVTGFWGGALSLIYTVSEDQIEYQRLSQVIAPAMEQAFTNVDYDNDPLEDRKTLVVGEDRRGMPIEQDFFLAKKEGQLQAIALETAAGGYEGDVGVITAILIEDEKVNNIDVTTHSETPGVGTMAMEPDYLNQFREKSLSAQFGAPSPQIDAVSGATVTSHAIQNAVQKGVDLYKEHKSEIMND